MERYEKKLSLTTNSVKTAWKLNLTLWNVASSSDVGPALCNSSVLNSKEQVIRPNWSRLVGETLETWKTKAGFKVNNDGFFKFFSSVNGWTCYRWSTAVQGDMRDASNLHCYCYVSKHPGAGNTVIHILSLYIYTHLFKYTYINTLNTYIYYLQYTVQFLASFAFANDLFGRLLYIDHPVIQHGNETLFIWSWWNTRIFSTSSCNVHYERISRWWFHFFFSHTPTWRED